MPKCQQCGEQADEVFAISVEGRRRKLCEECHEEAQEQAEIAAEAQGVMRNLMEYKG